MLWIYQRLEVYDLDKNSINKETEFEVQNT